MIDKIKQLKNLMSDKDILANIFLNCSSYACNNVIFLLKKKLSENLGLDLKDIKLIGSGHTGFTLNKEKSLQMREKIKDLDFVIINQNYFEKMYEEIKENNLIDPNKGLKYPPVKNYKYLTSEELFYKNYKNGKLHLMYVKPKFIVIEKCKEIDKYLNESFNINLKISCCIYRSEKEFLENQNKYYLVSLKKIEKEKIESSLEKIY